MNFFLRSDRGRLIGALAVVAAVTLSLGPWLRVTNAATVSITYLLLILLVAATSRLRVAVLTSIVAMHCLNFFFLPPIGTLTIADPENVVALIIFVAAAIGASVLVNRVAARSREALQARAEAEALAHTSSILIGEPDPLPALLDQLRTSFSLDAVSLLSNRDDGWIVDASAGPEPPTEPFDGERWDPDLHQDRVAVVHQEPQLFPNLTVGENLLVGREGTRARRRGLRPEERDLLADLPFKAVSLTLNTLMNAGHLMVYPPLCDREGSFVAQFEHTLYVGEDGVEVLTATEDHLPRRVPLPLGTS